MNGEVQKGEDHLYTWGIMALPVPSIVCQRCMNILMQQTTVPVLFAKSQRQYLEGLCAVELPHCGQNDTDMKVHSRSLI
jgi:hypothetical protein